MWRNSDGKICGCERWRSLQGFLFCSKSHAGISLIAKMMFEDQRESEERGRSI